MPSLIAGSVMLRPFRRGDELSLLTNLNDFEIARNTLKIPFPYNLQHAQKWIEHCIEQEGKKEEHIFAIDSGKGVIGCVDLHNIEPKHQAEIGYWLGRQHRGKGIMVGAVRAVTTYAFDQLGLVRVYGKVFTFNRASAKVVEKAGYKLEGCLRKSALKNGEYIDEWVYAITR